MYIHMEKEKKIKEVSSKKMRIVIGLFLSLFSLVLFINITAFPRVFTFGFAYLFGMASYLFYIALYAIGMLLVFSPKTFKVKIPVLVIVGSAILLIAAIILSTYISIAVSKVAVLQNVIVSFNNDTTKINFADAYNQVFFNYEKGNYLTQSTINLFSNKYPVGSGLFGYLLLACGNSLFNNASGGLILAIILFVIAFILFALPIVIRIVKESKASKGKKADSDFDIEEEEDEYIRPNYQANNPSKETIKIESKPESYQKATNNIETNDFIEPSFASSISNGMFVKPIFSIGDEQEDNAPTPIDSESIILEEQTPVSPQGQPSQAMFEEDSFTPAFEKREEPVVNEPVKEEKPVQREQIHLDFESKPQLDESLISAKPEYIDPVVTNKGNQPVQPQQVVPVEQTPAKRERVKWVAPSIDLLDIVEIGDKAEKNIAAAENRQLAIDEVFQNFKVGAHVKGYVVGPSVTRFNITYDPNVSLKQVENLVRDISVRLKGIDVRFAPIVEGQSYSGLEVPNAAIATVSFKDVFEALPDVKKHPLAVAFGKNVSGEVIWADFDEFPHILIAGTTGSGKSIFVNSIIATLIMRNSPDDLKIVLVDPKTVEMTRYKDMPHLLRPIIYTAKDTLAMARKLQEEMERRYALFSSSSGATNIKEYNEDCETNGNEKIPYIIFVLDEYADLIDQCKELSMPVVSLAQKARACGIHLLISTQRPSTNVVTGTIKANLPTHVALSCANTTDSITIIGEGGAEKLLGKGDMLVQSPLVSRVGCIRLQGCYASRLEITRVVQDLKARYETYYDPKFLNLEEEASNAGNEAVASPNFEANREASEQEKYNVIKDWVMTQQYMSISRIQRECQVGFNRAGKFFLRLQNEGIVDTQVEGNKGCRVLVSNKFDDDAPDVASDEQSYFREDF